MKRISISCSFAVALGVGLALVLLAVLSYSPAAVHAATRDWFAAAGSAGSCDQADPCALQTALGLAGDGDTIYVAAGTYTGTGTSVIAVTNSVTMYGGWDGAVSGPVVRDADAYLTAMDGQQARRVVEIVGAVTPTLEGFTFQNGDATGLGGDPYGYDLGGAVYVYANFASPLITDCRVLSSTAQFGGGVAAYSSTLILENSLIRGNVAISSGGGIHLYYSPATLVGNTVITNTASGSGAYQGGGGLYLDNSDATIRGNVIQDNSAQSPGGGLLAYQSDATIEGNTFQDNATQVWGGGLFFYQSNAFVRGNSILTNTAVSDGGGAFAMMSAVGLEGNTVLDNQSLTANAGGMAIVGCNPFTMTNNIVARNASQGYGPGLVVAGCIPPGCPGSYHSQGVLLHNTFVTNTSPLYVSMIHVGESSGAGATVAFTNTLVGLPGGVYVDQTGNATLDTTLWDSGLSNPAHRMFVAPGGIGSTQTDILGDPDLIAGTFHIGSNSAAIDQGAAVSVTVDIDGDARPFDGDGDGSAVADIGADEFAQHDIYLPLVLRNY